jgi:hypothetical protein
MPVPVIKRSKLFGDPAKPTTVNAGFRARRHQERHPSWPSPGTLITETTAVATLAPHTPDATCGLPPRRQTQ